MSRKNGIEKEELQVERFKEDFFGAYLRAVRTARGIKIRQLAKAVDKTPTYISDIEKSNNKPPEKELLDKIILELGIEEYPTIKTKLYDLAARERHDIPADVKEYIMQNTFLLEIIRNIKDKPNREQIWLEISTNL